MAFLDDLFGTRPNFSNVQSPYAQFAGIYPGLNKLTAQSGANIGSELSGNLPSDVVENIKDQGAAWGLNMGVPGSNISGNLTLKDLGLNSLEEQQRGFSDYLNFLGMGAKTQLDPGLQAEMDVDKASPNPTYAGLSKMISSGVGLLAGGII